MIVARWSPAYSIVKLYTEISFLDPTDNDNAEFLLSARQKLIASELLTKLIGLHSITLQLQNKDQILTQLL